eukprot:3208438-Amphidinium_carterae.1
MFPCSGIDPVLVPLCGNGIGGARCTPFRRQSRSPHVDQALCDRRGLDLLFLAHAKGTLVRTYFLSTWRHEGPSYHIELDASPWGLGGILFYQGTPI